MRSHFRKTLPDVNEVGDRMNKAANSAAQSARGAATQLEEWAKDGYDSVKTRPAIWGAASLGIGALAGGLYALWRNKDRIEGISGLDALWQRKPKANGRTMAARSRTKQARRAKLKMDGAANEEASQQPAKRAKRTKRARPAAQIEA
jgi:hypothetical protein